MDICVCMHLYAQGWMCGVSVICQLKLGWSGDGCDGYTCGFVFIHVNIHAEELQLVLICVWLNRISNSAEFGT